MDFNKDLIDLIVYDFDGVMTDNTVFVSEDGVESVKVSRADGWGVRKIREMGIAQMILSTEINPVVSVRAKKLELDVIHGCSDKKESLIDFCKKNQYPLKKVMYVGNDENDLEAMKIARFRVAPSDAHKKILDIATLITKARGGEGVIRELADYIP